MTENLGTCCICCSTEGVRNIMNFPQKAPVPGRGWGCVICHLPGDGAIAVLCDGCLEKVQYEGVEIPYACVGYPADNKRVPVAELRGTHEHDMEAHRRWERMHRPVGSRR